MNGIFLSRTFAPLSIHVLHRHLLSQVAIRFLMIPFVGYYGILNGIVNKI